INVEGAKAPVRKDFRLFRDEARDQRVLNYFTFDVTDDGRPTGFRIAFEWSEPMQALRCLLTAPDGEVAFPAWFDWHSPKDAVIAVLNGYRLRQEMAAYAHRASRPIGTERGHELHRRIGSIARDHAAWATRTLGRERRPVTHFRDLTAA